MDTLGDLITQTNEAEEARRLEREARVHLLAERIVASGLSALFLDAVEDERLAKREATKKGEGRTQRLQRMSAAMARTEALRQAVRLAYATPSDPKGWEAQEALFATYDAAKDEPAVRGTMMLRASRIRRDL